MNFFNRLFGRKSPQRVQPPVASEAATTMVAVRTNGVDPAVSPVANSERKLDPSAMVSSVSKTRTVAVVESLPTAADVPSSDAGRPAAERQTAEDQVPAEWQPGDVILDLYEVQQVFESGGMGLVYQVHHKGWNQPLAVKCPRAEFFKTEQHKQNFEREAETWVNLGLHPHIVSCHYVRRLGGIPRVFAEYMEGGSLKDWIDSGKLYADGPESALERMLDIAIQFAWGLHYAHEQGLIHQDVKPANVLMTNDGIAKVSDFGLAKAQAAHGDFTVSRPGASILVSTGGMTPAYCSPEQANQQPLSRRTDLWSWAVSLLEMFTGDVTWHSGVAAAEALEGYLDAGGSGDARIPLMPSGVADLLKHCFRRDPAQRPGTMLNAAETLQGVYERRIGNAYSRKLPEPAKARAASLNNRAVSLVDLNKLTEAEQVWKDAVQVEPQHIESTFNLGLQQWRTGQIDDIVLLVRLREMAASHSGEWLPQYLMAQVQKERGDCESVLKLVESLSQTEADSQEVHALEIWANEQLPTSRRCVRTYEKSESWVNTLCLSEDGRYALSGNLNKTLSLWDLSTGAFLRTFEGHSSSVTSVCLSRDGRFALSGSEDFSRKIKLWDVSTGECLGTLEGHSNAYAVTSVCLSGDGRYALSGSRDKTLKLWEASTGSCLRTFQGHAETVNSVDLSANGQFSVSGSYDKTLKLWESPTGRCVRTFEGHSHSVESVCFSRDGRFILSGGVDSAVKLWETSSGRCLRTLVGHTRSVDSVSLSSDGRHAVSAGSDQTIKIWELSTGRCLRSLEKISTKSVCLTSDGRHALSGRSDNPLQLWSIAWTAPTIPLALCRIVSTEADRAAAQAHAQVLRDARIAMSRGEHHEAVELLRPARAQASHARDQAMLELWSELYLLQPRCGLRSGWPALTFSEHNGCVYAACLSPDGRHALSNGSDQMFKLWELSTGRCVRSFEGHVANTLSFTPDGQYALSGCDDGTLKLWELSTGRCVRSFEGHRDWVRAACLSEDGRFALSGGSFKTLRLWEVSTGRCLRSFEGHAAGIEALCLSSDGRYALSGSRGFNSDDFSCKLWEVSTGRLLRHFEGHKFGISSVCLTVDGRHAVSGSTDKSLKLWDVSTGHCVRTFEGHSGPVSSVSLSADGRYILSGDEEHTVKLWELSTGRCLRSFDAHTRAVKSVSLSRDGRYALSGSSDKTLKLWFLDWELMPRVLADWDEEARPYLHEFLAGRVPYAAALPPEGAVTEEQITVALTRRGQPVWTEADFEQLLHTLGCAGYGWLRAEGVRREVEKMTHDWQGPPPLG